MTGSSQSPDQAKKKRRSRIVRINLYFFAVFALFSALIIRLGVVQIVHGEEYTQEVTKVESSYATYPAPRGKMYDRNHKVVVDNKSIPAISYTLEKHVKPDEMLATARKLAEYINIDPSFLRERDLRDYWLVAYPEKAKKLLSESEKTLEAKKSYPLQVERVPESELKRIKNDPKEYEIVAIFRRFSGGSYYEPQIVSSMDPDKKQSDKDNPGGKLTYEEVSKVSEHLDELPGVDIITDWTRSYPFGGVLSSIFGNITSPEQGILKEREDYYKTRGYAGNDRVGKSYIEYQYEEDLNPVKPKIKFEEDNNGNILSRTEVEKGRRGYDLQLSFDMELQKKVEKIIEEELRASRGRGNYMLDRAFVVMMDPNNGDVLSMAGKKVDYQTGKMNDFSYGAFTTQYQIGSTVKGATVLAGYQFGIPHRQFFTDRPLHLGTLTKSSWKTMGTINDLTALKQSSNVYMFEIAMNIAGVNYTPYGPLPADFEDLETMRNYYSQFGLGVPTGIDLPNEAAGGKSDSRMVGGLLLDEAIGQYDTYTPLQLAQYVSVIANGGYRVQPRVVSSVHQPDNGETIGPVLKDNKPNILNRINNSDEDIERVQQGFKMVTSSPGGTAFGLFGSNDVSGKTGTAQAHYYDVNREWFGRETYNLTFAGYYPSENPQVAFSVIVPWVQSDKDRISKNISKRVIDAYVDQQKEYSKE
ncbi:penicillin-binding protein 2 [Bacillus gobiensis]|uniref:peptidoglycan D,D-transpeptidase FtsI family protein n=1 Tax=Bacillus gobiensis TaxID=1441095 RepID=UPI003D19D94B